MVSSYHHWMTTLPLNPWSRARLPPILWLVFERIATKCNSYTCKIRAAIQTSRPKISYYQTEAAAIPRDAGDLGSSESAKVMPQVLVALVIHVFLPLCGVDLLNADEYVQSQRRQHQTLMPLDYPLRQETQLT